MVRPWTFLSFIGGLGATLRARCAAALPMLTMTCRIQPDGILPNLPPNPTLTAPLFAPVFVGKLVPHPDYENTS